MLTPYYAEPGITIYHADCQEILPSLQPATLILTDPPYNAINRPTDGLRRFDKGFSDAAPIDIPSLAPLFARLAPSLYVWCSDEQYTPWVQAFNSFGMTIRKCVWWKTNPSPMNGQHLWLSALELCVFARRPGAYFSLHCAPPVWHGPTDQHPVVSLSTQKTLHDDHPTPKPLWLFKQLVLASTPARTVIIDPFMGSGTTLLAAKELGREAIGIDIQEKNCELAVNRLRQGVLNFA